VERGAGYHREPLGGGASHPAVGLDLQKKTLGAAERDEEVRQAYRERVAPLSAERFVVVDECGSNVGLTPLYGRAPRGERAYGSAPRNTGKNITLIAALSIAGMGPALTLQGATDAAAFEIYVEHLLAPTLAPGQIVILDNLSAHKGRRVREAVAARGCEVWYLPAYSPDLSPIEEAFAKLKALLRRAEARTYTALETAIADALAVITAADARAFFADCGYGLMAQ
jgi:transposase